jgi:hypothetical protein
MAKTVYVLGAGASSEAGLPVGTDLKKSIAAELRIEFEHGIRQVQGSFLLVAALRDYVQRTSLSRDINPYLHAGWRISEAMSQAISIDNFLDAHKDDPKIVLCGKLAIATSILNAERNSSLFLKTEAYNATLDFDRLQNTWFNSFMQIITENCAPNDLKQRFETIKLVIFNYDRCFEHYVYYWLQNYYALSEQQAADLVGLIDIYHPYGVVGSLPWQKFGNSISFGADPQKSQLLALAEKIKTFTEGTDPDASAILAIRSAMYNAEKIVFLGFAFHRMNLSLLWGENRPEHSRPSATFLGTAKGISADDVTFIRSDLISPHGNVAICELRNDLTCAGLFDAYRRRLSFV